MKPRLLDLFCKAGGAGRGYADAGFEVIGVDIEPQRRYPYTFIQADVFAVLPDLIELYRPAAIHASPTCKVHTSLKPLAAAHHTNQIPQTREMLAATGLPYVIENVPGAPLVDPVWLCGSMFGLAVRRHRGFELGHWKTEQPACRHAEQDAASPGYPYQRSGGRWGKATVVSVHGTGNHGVPVAERRRAMGIEWMTGAELSQAIPPAYTRFIGKQLIAALNPAEASDAAA